MGVDRLVLQGFCRVFGSFGVLMCFGLELGVWDAGRVVGVGGGG